MTRAGSRPGVGVTLWLCWSHTRSMKAFALAAGDQGEPAGPVSAAALSAGVSPPPLQAAGCAPTVLALHLEACLNLTC